MRVLNLPDLVRSLVGTAMEGRKEREGRTGEGKRGEGKRVDSLRWVEDVCGIEVAFGVWRIDWGLGVADRY